MDFFFFQAEDGIRDLVRSRGLGDVYKRQVLDNLITGNLKNIETHIQNKKIEFIKGDITNYETCLLYTSDAADERSSVDLGGRRIIKKKNHLTYTRVHQLLYTTH